MKFPTGNSSAIRKGSIYEAHPDRLVRIVTDADKKALEAYMPFLKKILKGK